MVGVGALNGVEQPENKTAMETSKKRIEVLFPFTEAGIIDSVKSRINKTKFRMKIIRSFFFIIRFCLIVIQEIFYSEYV